MVKCTERDCEDLENMTKEKNKDLIVETMEQMEGGVQFNRHHHHGKQNGGFKDYGNIHEFMDATEIRQGS